MGGQFTRATRRSTRGDHQLAPIHYPSVSSEDEYFACVSYAGWASANGGQETTFDLVPPSGSNIAMKPLRTLERDFIKYTQWEEQVAQFSTLFLQSTVAVAVTLE
eukprot:gene26004-biopygen12799